MTLPLLRRTSSAGRCSSLRGMRHQMRCSSSPGGPRSPSLYQGQGDESGRHQLRAQGPQEHLHSAAAGSASGGNRRCEGQRQASLLCIPFASRALNRNRFGGREFSSSFLHQKRHPMCRIIFLSRSLEADCCLPDLLQNRSIPGMIPSEFMS